MACLRDFEFKTEMQDNMLSKPIALSPLSAANIRFKAVASGVLALENLSISHQDFVIVFRPEVIRKR